MKQYSTNCFLFLTKRGSQLSQTWTKIKLLTSDWEKGIKKKKKKKKRMTEENFDFLQNTSHNPLKSLLPCISLLVTFFHFVSSPGKDSIMEWLHKENLRAMKQLKRKKQAQILTKKPLPLTCNGVNNTAGEV